jgi:predicted glycosyltransferase
VKDQKIIWIDFENAPHVWVMSNIIERLRRQGYAVHLTARDFSYTLDLCKRFRYTVEEIGVSGFGTSTPSKAWRILKRALLLYRHMYHKRKQIAVALSHGARSHILAAHFLGIPVISLDDYEYSDQSVVRFVDHLLVPFLIPKDIWGRYAGRVVHYPGPKESLYLCTFNPDAKPIKFLSNDSNIKVLFRPEGRFSHYRSSKSEILQKAILDYLAGHSHTTVVLLPRDDVQANDIARYCKERSLRYVIPDKVYDGPVLIGQMDLMISGGGTMTREAAVMGVPSYSFFAGQWGAVDRYFAEKGTIIKIAEISDVDRISVKKRIGTINHVSMDTIDFVSDFIEGQIQDRVTH